jgi:hypothetical protein
MTSPVGSIVSDGDVVFVVGEEKRQLRVHSLFLRTVSSVFNALLGPRYSEGINLSSDTPKSIPLPEDDPETMEIIFNIVHFRTDTFSDQLEPEALIRLAIAIDKYDMVQALKVYTRGWLYCDSIQDPGRLWQLAKASYLLHNDQAFKSATLGLLCHYGEPYLRLYNKDTSIIDIGDQFLGMSR